MSNKAQNTKPATTKEELVKLDSAKLIEQFGTKSSAIRGLNAVGFERKEISKMLGIRYQHVRNVLITPIKNAKVVTKEATTEQK